MTVDGKQTAPRFEVETKENYDIDSGMPRGTYYRSGEVILGNPSQVLKSEKMSRFLYVTHVIVAC